MKRVRPFASIFRSQIYAWTCSILRTSATGCAYKGFARYWSATIGAAELENVAWSYATPIADCAKIAGLIAFYHEHVDIIVDGVPRRR
jgi:uncharacterized protein (DUF427 family)